MQTGRPDVAALRQAIDERLRGRAAFSEVSYGDQPIVFSGRQLKSYVPQRLSDARALARSPEMLRHSEAYVFWRQAQLLADYEDDYDFHGHFSRYYPTYEVMSNDQLRGYFAWRTEWRAGATPDTETSFVYVLAYELLMGVGAADARDGYAQLARLCEDYGDLDPHVVQNLGRWMDDYIVYWGLPADLLGSLAHREADRALGVLLHRRDHADGELFAAMEALSSYHMGKSVFYKGHAEDVQRVAVRVYRAMADHHDRDLKRSLVETYFGVSLEQDYVLFPNAVFVDQRRYEDYTYEVSPLDHFRCRGARWSRDRYAGNLRPNRKLGALLKTIDATMRELYGFKPALQAPLTTKYVLKLIETETDALLAARAEAERRAVHIDLSKLGGIRAAADKTRDSLLVDEDEVESLFPMDAGRQTRDASGPCFAYDPPRRVCSCGTRPAASNSPRSRSLRRAGQLRTWPRRVPSTCVLRFGARAGRARLRPTRGGAPGTRGVPDAYGFPGTRGVPDAIGTRRPAPVCASALLTVGTCCRCVRLDR